MENKELTPKEKLNNIISNIDKGQSKIIFCIPETPIPTASIYEVYFAAKVYRDNGYRVIILTDGNVPAKPEWLNSDFDDFEHRSLNDPKLETSAADIMVISENLTNVMESTKNLPCIRITFLQSIDYLLNGLMPNMSLQDLGIKNILTTNNNIKELIEMYEYKDKYQFKTYNIGIPEYFRFNPDKTIKEPIISVVARNSNEIMKVIKLFYQKYPQYTWITFDTMQSNDEPPSPLDRESFAEILKKNFAVLWLDRISNFGTLPLESMMAGTIPIGLLPDLPPPYLYDENNNLKENIGYWTSEIYELPQMIGKAITEFLSDSVSDEKLVDMQKHVSEYNTDKSAEQLLNVVHELLAERKEAIKNAINNLEEKETVKENE